MRSWDGCLRLWVSSLSLRWQAQEERRRCLAHSCFCLGDKRAPKGEKMGGQYFVVHVCSNLTPNQTKTLCDFFSTFLYFWALFPSGFELEPWSYNLRVERRLHYPCPGFREESQGYLFLRHLRLVLPLGFCFQKLASEL